ncbi:MAG TPA: protein kinase, partial [Terriglobia bacterium]|nr:protein kinase [Terriglobia bacterium]
AGIQHAPAVDPRLREGDDKRRTALQLDTILEYGIEIAGALAAAHRLGIIHRDLKPQNIMLTKSGTKLLDFGLAKSLTSSPSPGGRGEKVLGSQPSPQGRGWPAAGGPGEGVPTADPLTAQGAIMGTLHYMAPEQLEGKPADARSDIFAFGCVLYEMATGKRAFEGESSAQVLAAIMQNDPKPITNVGPNGVRPLGQQDAPNPVGGERRSPLQRVVMKCLAKDPDDRWQSAADLRDELKWIKEGEVVAAISDRRPNEKIGGQRPPLQLKIAWAMAAVGIIAAGILAVVAARLLIQPHKKQAISFLVHPPSFTPSFYGAAPVLSPDGRKLVFIAASPGAEHMLWVRSLDDPVAAPIPGTEGALCAFWSPDSRHLGFVTVNGIKRVDAQGGPVTVLSNASAYGDATWSRNGTILFAVQLWVGGRIYRISDSGGQATPVTALDPSRHEVAHEWPRFLPDGMHFLYAAYRNAYPQGNWMCVGSLDSKKTNCLVRADSRALYAPEGYLLYLRSEALVAQPFDAKRFALIGDPVPIAQPVDPYSFSVSDTGVLAYQQGHASAVSYEGGRAPTVGQQLIWLDRAGKKLGTVGPLGSYSNPALSPDATKLAVDVRNPEVSTRDIWIFDLKRATASRLNSNPADDFAPVWSADGTRIFFTSDRLGQRNFYQKAANGLGESEVVFLSPYFKSTLDLSSDGRYLLFDSFSGSQPLNGLWILPQFGSRHPASFIGGKGDANPGDFSPDGRYLAYVSNETGRREVYVQSFPEHRAKLLISANGGDEPAWRRDGKELFYLADNKMMAVSVKADSSTFQAGIPRLLFKAPLTPFNLRNRCVVTPDGKRFLCIVPERQEMPQPITVVVNWPALLKK